MKKWLPLLWLSLWIVACVPPSNREIKEIRKDLKDPIYRQLIGLQDRQKTDSLYPFLQDRDPSYRYAAALAFGSIRQKEAIDSLAPLLKDKIPAVREAAAFALGQAGDVRAQDALISAFNTVDTMPASNPVNKAILEAIGRCGDESKLPLIASVTTYRPTDTLLLEGQAASMYYFALRDLIHPAGTEKMVDFVCSEVYPPSVRLIAASYLRRAKGLDLSSYSFRLNKTFRNEKVPFIKMDLALALGRTGDAAARQSLLDELNKNNDYRLKVNIIRALGSFTYIDGVEAVLLQLKNPNVQIALTAAEYLLENGQPNDVVIYRRHAKEIEHWQVKSKIYEAILKHVPSYFSTTRSASMWDIRKLIEASSDPYEKAAYIRVLGHDRQALKMIREYGFTANEFPVRTAAVEALNQIIRTGDPEKEMNRYQFNRYREEVAGMLRQAFESEDEGMIALAAIGIREAAFDLKEAFESLDFIGETRNRLTLPQDVECYNEILRLESYLEGTDYKPVSIGYNHPIDWKTFDKITPDTRAVIETNKGVFEMRFLADEAPGSVVNFIELAEKGYFEGKRIHRVVPNFVMQTGCSRGDGWGSLPYTIRSELTPRHYDREGWVGMASAGNHTESAQWFVTHSPTLHLNGNYTLFGEIVEGMNTVLELEIGDVIQSVAIRY